MRNNSSIKVIRCKDCGAVLKDEYAVLGTCSKCLDMIEEDSYIDSQSMSFYIGRGEDDE